MNKNRIIFAAAIGVTIIAAVKTISTTALLLQDAETARGTKALLFLVFWVLTAGVAAAVVHLFRQRVGQRRIREIMGTLGEEPGKENLLEAHARDWGLTAAETEVAILAVKGFSNAEIARMRNSALPTVKSQFTSIYQKSGLQNRVQLIAFITDEVCEATRAARVQTMPDVAPAPAKAHDPRPAVAAQRPMARAACAAAPIDARSVAAPQAWHGPAGSSAEARGAVRQADH